MGIGARTKPTRKKKQPLPEPKERLRPVSLYPLEFDGAMKGLIAFQPNPSQETHSDSSRDGLELSEADP